MANDDSFKLFRARASIAEAFGWGEGIPVSADALQAYHHHHHEAPFQKEGCCTCRGIPVPIVVLGAFSPTCCLESCHGVVMTDANQRSSEHDILHCFSQHEAVDSLAPQT